MAQQPLILTKEQIKEAVDIPEVIRKMEEGFALYSTGEAVIPPFGSLHFQTPPGHVHIKHGHIKKSPHYVVKIASGFYDNPKQGLPSSQGLMLVFCSKTGRLEAILLDDAYLTDIRTGAAGAVAAKYFAPKKVSCIGIVGTGTQAFRQLQLLKEVVDCRDVAVWGRSADSFKRLLSHPELGLFNITPTTDIKTVTKNCNLIVTTTPAASPLLFAEDIQPGTHITAVGADGKGKQELDPEIFRIADIVCVDSREQCFQHGDISHAIEEGLVDPTHVIEIGEVVLNPHLGRVNDDQITVADLTGVAIQDIQIANTVLACVQGGAS